MTSPFAVQIVNAPSVIWMHRSAAITREGRKSRLWFRYSERIRISVHETTLGTTVANLGMTNTTFPAPVFFGDTLRTRTTVVSKRSSKSRPSQGIVNFKHEGMNQDGVVVCICERAALMHCKPEIDAT